jgi:hypothetical protein
MKTPSEIEQLTNQVLNSLDNLQQVDANPYLYAKIINRMQHSRQNAAARKTRLMYGLTAALLLFVCVNVTSFYLLTRSKAHSSTKTTNGAAALRNEYFPQNDQYSY